MSRPYLYFEKAIGLSNKLSKEVPPNKFSKSSIFYPIIFLALFLFGFSRTNIIDSFILYLLWLSFSISLAWYLFWDSFLQYKLGVVFLNLIFMVLVGIGYSYIDGYYHGIKINFKTEKNIIIQRNSNLIVFTNILFTFNNGILIKNGDIQFIPYTDIKTISYLDKKDLNNISILQPIIIPPIKP